MNINPLSQRNLFEHKEIFNHLAKLYKKDNLPNKILLSGEKGIGKSTLACHLINFILSENEEYAYDYENNKIESENRSYKLIQNRSNPNFYLIDVLEDKKNIDINQIRELIIKLNQSSFNKKKRFVLIDNIELLNINSINSLLKILEEPNENINFILINNNKKILSTLSSRCINFKIFLTHKECLEISKKLVDDNLNSLINNNLVNYYFTPGNLYALIKFAQNNNYDLKKFNLKELLKIIIKENQYKKNSHIKFIFLDLIEYYFRSLNFNFTTSIYNKYSYFLKRISDTRKFNLDDETLFLEFKDNILNG